MSGSPDFALSTTIEMDGETFFSQRVRPPAHAEDDVRPVLRCDLPLPTRDEMADDGGAAALIARSRKVK